MKQNFIEDNIIIISKQTLDIILKEKNPSDLIGLYCFYYYTAKWQKTNIVKCTTGYVCKGLQWSKEKTINAKNALKKIGLIEDEKRKNKKGQVVGWYIKINYVWKKSTINQRVASPESGKMKQVFQKPEGGLNQRVENPPTNALSANSINALSANIDAVSVSSRQFLMKIPSADIDRLKQTVSVTTETIKSKGEDLYHYCEAKGRRYKNYYSVLLNALKRDYPQNIKMEKYQ